jgi:hypothetical protein
VQAVSENVPSEIDANGRFSTNVTLNALAAKVGNPPFALILISRPHSGDPQSHPAITHTFFQ